MENRINNSILRYSLAFFVAYINIGNYFFVIPMHIDWNKRTGYEVTHGKKWRKVLCGLTALGCYIGDATNFLQLILSTGISQRAPRQYFDLARRISVYFSYSLSIVMIWRRSKSLQYFLDHIQWNSTLTHHSLIPLKPIKKKVKLLYSVLIISFSLLNHLTFVMHGFLKNHWNLENWTQTWIQAFNQQYFLQNLSQNLFVQSTSLILGFSVTTLAINFQCFTTWMPIVATIVLFTVVQVAQDICNSKLSSPIESNGNFGIGGVIECHECIKKIFKNYNEIFGGVIFGLTIILIPQFVFYFIELIDPSTIARFVKNILRYLNLAIFLSFAAVINNRSNILIDWIIKKENYMTLSFQRLSILLFESTTQKVGIYAWGLFKVSAEAVGSVVMAILTFSIINLQFRNTCKDLDVKKS